MTAQNVPLSDHGREYVAAVIQSGEAKDAAEVVDLALRKMEADQHTMVEEFRESVRAGVDDLDQGRFTAVASDDLPEFIKGLSPRLAAGEPKQ